MQCGISVNAPTTVGAPAIASIGALQPLTQPLALTVNEVLFLVAGLRDSVTITLTPDKRRLVIGRGVEDDDLLRSYVKKILERVFSFAVVEAVDGEKGLELIFKEDFDLVVTDHDMPKLNGTELIERSRKQYSELSFIMMSGSLLDDFELADDIVLLDKPFKLDELINTIKRILGIE